MNKKIHTAAIILLIIYIIVSLYFLFTTVSLDVKDGLWSIPTDKIFHFLMFMPYPVIFWMIIKYGKKNYKKSFGVYFSAFTISLILGSLTEIAQKYLSYSRNGDIKDLLADALGIIFALLLLWIFESRIDRLLLKLFADRKKSE